MSPPITPRQHEEKMRSMEMQERYNAAGQVKFERQKQAVIDEGKEKVARGILQGGLTWQQSLDLPKRTMGGFSPGAFAGYTHDDPWVSDCCRKTATNYRSLHIAGEEPERFFRCRECGEECTARKKQPKRKSSSKRSKKRGIR